MNEPRRPAARVQRAACETQGSEEASQRRLHLLLLPLLVLAAAWLLRAAPGMPMPSSIALRVVDSAMVASDDEEELLSLVLADDRGRTIPAFLRRPAHVREPVPTIVLLAGRYAGREAARLIPAPLDAVVLAVEYPDEIPTTLGLVGSLRRLPSIRATAERMPGMLAGAGHFAAALPEVDAARIALVGVSFGVPFAAAAGRDPVFGAVVLAYGGAGFVELFDANLPIANDLARRASARMAAWWLDRLEPERHVADIAPRPLLLINGLYDELIPRGTAERLGRAAVSPVEHVWLPNRHIGARRGEMIDELATLVHRFMDRAFGASPPHGGNARGARDAP